MVKFDKDKYPLFEIVADGGLSTTEVGEGRFIPGVIVDIKDKSEVKDLINAHKNSPAGNTIVQWCKPFSIFRVKTLILKIQFKTPMDLTFGILFQLEKQSSLVDGIIHSRGLYLQSGKPGDKVSNSIGGGILIEIPDLEFDAEWKRILPEFLAEKYRKKGASKSDAKLMAQAQIKSMREIWSIRR